jgi:hypothetical protein
MRTHIVVALLALSASAYGTPSDALTSANAALSAATEKPASNTFEQLTYREYMSLDTQARRQVFNRISVANTKKKAALVRAQVEAWREAHSQELNEDQLTSIDEILAIIDPELYAVQKSPDKQLQMQEIMARVNVRYSPEQIRELMLLESKH